MANTQDAILVSLIHLVIKRDQFFNYCPSGESMEKTVTVGL